MWQRTYLGGSTVWGSTLENLESGVYRTPTTEFGLGTVFTWSVYRLGVYSRKSRVWESTGLEPPDADLEPHMPVLKKRYFGPFTSFLVVHGKMCIPLLKLTLHIALTEIDFFFHKKNHMLVLLFVLSNRTIFYSQPQEAH